MRFALVAIRHWWLKVTEQQGLQQLALNGRAFHGDDGLLREDGHAFLDGPDVAVQLEVGQVVQKLLIECAFVERR